MDDDTLTIEEVRENLVDSATILIASGYDSPEEILDKLIERFDDQEPPLDEEEIRATVTPMFAARRAEEATWPERTDNTLLDEAFAALRERGLTVEDNFTCCQSCGLSEIGGQAAEDSPGYVFFHQQDTESAAAGYGLMLAYGAFGGDEEASTAIGHQTVDALRAAGLTVEWDGSIHKRILVRLEWRERMPED